ncbi:MAG: hypothetical protein NWR47_01615 [Aestuariivirgaceae bacterium]|nr:hypothetical protein [Aestuariivirgaceae bacterium]
MSNSINPAFGTFTYSNLNDPAAFIKAMQTAKPSLNTEVSKLKGEG